MEVAQVYLILKKLLMLLINFHNLYLDLLLMMLKDKYMS